MRDATGGLMSPWSRVQRWWWLRGRRGESFIDPSVRIEGRVWIPGEGTVRLGPGVALLASTAPIELRAAAGAEIVIGEGSVLEAGCSVEAATSVQIGARVRLGAFSKVIDNHCHEAAGDRHKQPPSVPVVVGDGVTVGPRAILLPGAHLGRGVRVGPATVVSRRLPADVTVAGSPPLVCAS
jgi:acetyltransferase-like isoleucine patch superfamily enzyme